MVWGWTLKLVCRCMVVLRLRNLYAEATAGLAECCLKGAAVARATVRPGAAPPKAQEALSLAEAALCQETWAGYRLQQVLTAVGMGRICRA